MTEQLAVAVLGANGRMGAEAVKAVEAAADLKLVAALGRNDSLDTLVDCRSPDRGGPDGPREHRGERPLRRRTRHARRRGHHRLGCGEAGPARGAPRRPARRRSPDRAELRARLGPGLRLRGQGLALLRIGRNHRTAPPGQGGRPVRNGRAHRAADLRRARRRRPPGQPRRHHQRSSPARAAATSTASASTASGSAASWRTRKSCWAARGSS